MIEAAEVEHSILLAGSSVRHLDGRMESSLLGRNVRIARGERQPRAYRFMIGDNSEIGILVASALRSAQPLLAEEARDRVAVEVGDRDVAVGLVQMLGAGLAGAGVQTRDPVAELASGLLERAQQPPPDARRRAPRARRTSA